MAFHLPVKVKLTNNNCNLVLSVLIQNLITPLIAEFDIIDHSFKYSMAKIKDAVHQSPDRFDYVVNDLRHRNEGDGKLNQNTGFSFLKTLELITELLIVS